MRLSLAFCVALAASCAKNPPPPKDESSPPTAAPEAAPAAPEKPLADQMFEHFMRVTALEHAVIEGDQTKIREHATALAKPRSGDPPEWATEVEHFQRAVGAVLNAADLKNAAIATATVVHQCGSCHSKFGIALDDEHVPSPPPNATVEQKMRRHEWATDLMRTSLVFSSDALWKQGADNLGTAALHPSEVTGDGPIDPDVVELVRDVRELATEAASAPPENRQGIYGAVLATCAGCHAKTR